MDAMERLRVRLETVDTREETLSKESSEDVESRRTNMAPLAAFAPAELEAVPVAAVFNQSA
jgi:hypothetical protein